MTVVAYGIPGGIVGVFRLRAVADRAAKQINRTVATLGQLGVDGPVEAWVRPLPWGPWAVVSLGRDSQAVVEGRRGTWAVVFAPPIAKDGLA